MVIAMTFWVVIPLVGKKYFKLHTRRIAAWLLMILTLGQELINELIVSYQGLWNISTYLPIHLCGFSLFLISWVLVTKNQDAFELAYFWGLAGATQAILTPDLSEINSHAGIFIYFFSHSIIILDVIWLIYVEGMRLRKGSLINAIFLTNGFAFLVSIVNNLIGGNYCYLCHKPKASSPFLIGEWPFYLLSIQAAGVFLMGLIYLPWLPYFQKKSL